MKIVITKEFLQDEIMDLRRKYQDELLEDQVEWAATTRAKIETIEWFLAISEPLAKTVKPLLEEAYEEGDFTCRLCGNDDDMVNGRREKYISQTLEKLNQ